jgi:uncharacterized protein
VRRFIFNSMSQFLKVAIIGSGISGLGAAHALNDQAEVSLFEAGDYFGGHSHTVDITLPVGGKPVTHGVDTGFLVYNERTYPNLIALFAQLGVETTATDMSFAVKVPDAFGAAGQAGSALEWSGASLDTVFAQRRNLVRPAFLGMLMELLRLNRLCTRIAEQGQESALSQPLGDFLREQRFSRELRDWYLLPMLGCIWSCPTDQMLQFPVATMIRFCHNHGLMQVSKRPRWFTVTGGSRHYVDKIVAGIRDKRLNTPVQLIERDADGVRVITRGHAERFDRVIIATHAPQALALLRDASPREREVLGTFRTQANHVVLHTDASVLPANRKTWSAWNYTRGSQIQESGRVCLHYLINKLQPIPFQQPVVVSLNPVEPIQPASVLQRFEYAHPVMDMAAIAMQPQLDDIQGVNHTWFAGAWMGYGFHEDGLKAGLAAARALLKQIHEPRRELLKAAA